jgi:catechol 2,3-dioxygenase
MALKGVLRPGYIQIRVTDLDAHSSIMSIASASTRSVARRMVAPICGPGTSSTATALSCERPICRGWIMSGSRSRARLSSTHSHAGSRHSAGEQPGVGHRLSFLVPTGHRNELFAEMALSDNGPMTSNPEMWRDEPHGMRVTRFDHCNLHGPNIDGVVKFFVEVLDFSLTEAAETPDGIVAAFLSCSNKAHDVAFIRRAEPDRFHHVAFALDSWHEVGQAADIIARYDIPLDIGPTRHGITRGQTIYFFDPSGNRNEVLSGGFIYYPDNPKRVWSMDKIGKAIFYYQREVHERFMGVVT